MKTRGKAIRSAALIIAGLTLPAVAVPLLLGAAGRDEDPAYEANRRKIESMSRERRNRLQRNYEQFLALSESDRDKFRELHRAVEDDARQGGNLRAVLERYNGWLKTLLPFQREELRKQDPAARMTLISQYMEEQRHERWVRSLPERHQYALLRERNDPEKRKDLELRFRREQERTQSGRASVVPGSMTTYWGSSSQRDLKLCRDDFEAVMSAVESSVKLPEEDLQKLKSATKAQRYLLVLLRAVKQPSGQPESRDQLNWPDDALLDQTIAKISRDSVRERIELEEQPEGRRLLMARLIVRRFLSEWWEQNAPDEEELREFFENLDPGEQDRITNLTGWWQKRTLTRRYFEEHPPAYSDEYREFWGTAFMRTLRRLSGYSGRRRGFKHGDGPKTFDRRESRESKVVEPVEAPRPRAQR